MESEYAILFDTIIKTNNFDLLNDVSNNFDFYNFLKEKINFKGTNTKKDIFLGIVSFYIKFTKKSNLDIKLTDEDKNNIMEIYNYRK